MRDFRRIKINEDDVPASRHSLFFRGLDLDITREKLEKFFNDESGPCRVVFYKPNRDSVCAAVRFDDRKDASKCLQTYEDRKIMNCKVDITWYKDVRAYADKLERNYRPSHKSYTDRGSSFRRYSGSKHSKRRSPSRGISISSDDSPKRKHHRRRSSSSERHHSRSRSPYSSSSSSSESSRHTSTKKKLGPHTPPQTPPLDQTEEFDNSCIEPDYIKSEVVGLDKNVCVVTLNRPKSMNALCTGLIDELTSQISKYDADKSIGAIVLTGSQHAFSAGADIKELVPMNLPQCYENGLLDKLSLIAKVKKPIIAAVNGYALGEGCELALSCDIVYAGDKAEFGQPEILVGTIPGAQRLTRVVGKSLAMEMCLTGERINAEEALKRGLVSKVFPAEQLIDETIKLAEKIAKNSPLINNMTKESVNRAFETNLQEGLLHERRMFYTTFSIHDRREGMSAFLDKRAPKWTST